MQSRIPSPQWADSCRLIHMRWIVSLPMASFSTVSTHCHHIVHGPIVFPANDQIDTRIVLFRVTIRPLEHPYNESTAFAIEAWYDTDRESTCLPKLKLDHQRLDH